MHLVARTRVPDGIGNIKSLRHLHAFYLGLNTLDNIKGLGELTNLRYIFLRCGPLGDDKEKRMDALCSSLGRLCNLEELLVDLPGCMDGLMPFSPPSILYRLERLLLLEDCWFSKVPSWMRELHNLCELQCRVGELLNDGVGILGELPALTHLNIKVRKATNEMIVIYGGGAFPALKRLMLKLSSTSYLTFQAGAMPKLQRLEIEFNAEGSEQNGAAPAGIEHLSALEEFAAGIGCEGATVSEQKSVESALRSTINVHPNHPRIGIEVYDFNLEFSDH